MMNFDQKSINYYNLLLLLYYYVNKIYIFIFLHNFNTFTVYCYTFETMKYVLENTKRISTKQHKYPTYYSESRKKYDTEKATGKERHGKKLQG